MPTRAGKLRERVEVQRATRAQDSFGEADETWRTIGYRWAEATQIGGREALRNNVDLAEEPWLFYLRRDSLTATLTPKDRLRYDGRVFRIEVVKNVEQRNARLELTCRTVEYRGS